MMNLIKQLSSKYLVLSAVLFYLAPFLLTEGAPALAQQCVTPLSGLVSWWGGDNNALDLVGTNNGTLMNGTTFAPGMVGQAFSFDGVDDYVNVGNLSLPVAFTVDAWIKPVATVDLQWILAKDNPGTSQRSYFFFLDNAGALGLFVRNGNGKDTSYETGSAAAIVGQWSHVAAVYDGNAALGQKIKFYVNGQSMAATYFSGDGGTPETNSVDTLIGKHPVYPSFNGLIDEVEIFSRALSAEEIAAIYNAGSAGKCRPSCVQPPSGLVSWWGADNNALDMVGTNNGTLVNGTAYAPGKVGQAFSLDGIDDYVQIPHSDSLNFGPAQPISINLWVKRTSTSDISTVFAKRSDCGAQVHYILQWYGPGDWFHFGSTGGLENGVHTTADKLPLNSWTFVSISFDGTTATMYINGAPVASHAMSFDPNTVPLTLGAEPSCGDYFGGLIDEFEIFNRALSAEEISAIYAAGSAGKCRSCVQPPSGMVSWWGGDNNALDMVGTNNGTLMNGTTYAPGKVGQAFSLDGVDDYVSIPNGIIPPTARNFTVDAWVYADSINGNGENHIVYSGPSGGGEYYLANRNGNFEFAIYTDSGWYRVGIVGETGVWRHLTGVRRGTQIEIWVDGLLRNSLAVPDSDLVTGANVHSSIGSYNRGQYGFWDGLIDEAAIFNRALSAEEIAAIYAAGSAGICDDGDGVAPSVEDAAPNNGDGNGDGVPDSQQAHVTSLPSAAGSGYVTVVVSGGCSQIQSVTTYTAASQGNDPNFDYPYGLVGFSIPCSTATVKVIFHNAANLNGFTYRKFGPTPPAFSNSQWYTLPGVTFGTEVIGGQTVATATFTLTDGQFGDDTDVDGVIVDQGGPGLPVDQTGPSLAITSHTNNQDVETASITLSGTASDSGKGDNGIQQVTVNGSPANNGTASGGGPANWNMLVTLNPGANTITVIAYDNSSGHNQTSQTITIFYDVINTIYVSKAGGCNGHSNCRTNIQDGIALACALAPSIIEITQEDYDQGGIVLDCDEEIVLKGGWNTNFQSCSSYTTIKGSMTITHGTIIIENIILK